MFDRSWKETSESAPVVDRIRTAARAENAAAGARLAAMAELFVVREREHARASWAVDTTIAVSAEVAAALSISEGLARSYLYYAQEMRTRLPKVGEALLAGDIGYLTFQAIAFRTDLVRDPEVIAAIDADLAVKVRRWPAMSRGRLNAAVDAVVVRKDPDAARRRREIQTDREFVVGEAYNGLTEVSGRLVPSDASAVDTRLDELASTVCEHDPRNRKQRRADAMGAMAAGADRLACRCGRPDCAAAGKPAKGPVAVHVLAQPASLDGTGTAPGLVLGDQQELIPAELLAELAQTAQQLALVVPVDAEPESGYRPSKALADFVRFRDLTCRFPSCDKPAAECDLDHTVPYSRGGLTHASNIKCECRVHHLLKTFWGWRDQQLPDGTVIWTAPSGHVYVTTPGSALLFPALCVPTGQLPPPTPPPPPPPGDGSGDRSERMPKRRRTRAQNHARYVAAQRRANHQARQAAKAAKDAAEDAAFEAAYGRPRGDPDEPPPF